MGVYRWAVVCLVVAVCHARRAPYLAAEEPEARDLGSWDAESRDPGDTDLGRLPTSLYPLHYIIELQHDTYSGPPPFAFNGSVEILFECQEATNAIFLNSKELDIPESSIELFTYLDTPVASPDPVWTGTQNNDTLQFYIVNLQDPLTVGANYVIRLTFSGMMSNILIARGILWTSYESEDGGTKYVVNTQYQDSLARSNFPCFDEPSFKATHDVIIWRKSPDMALGNMPLIRTEPRQDGWVADYFTTTAKMSVYLVAFVVGEFDYREAFTNRGVPVRVWTRPEYAKHLDFANSICAKFQDWYETYTGVEYPLPKQDHVSIPGKSGAMENWGLVLYGDSFLLWDNTTDTLNAQRFVAMIVGHELAHMWFGDLVTCDWWNNIWLNEGFATYFSSMPFDDVLGWSGDEMQYEQELGPILNRDSRNNSLPIRLPVQSPWNALLTFGSSTYSKGSAVLRMLYQVMGPSSFQTAVNNYLNAYAYGNVNTDDLWQAMTDQAAADGVTDTDGSALDIKLKFDPWVNARGYPLITANRINAGSIEFSQEMFLNPTDQDVNVSPYNNAWYVPLTWTDQTALDFSMTTKQWLNQEASKVVTDDLPNSIDEWFLVDLNLYDFFRVMYDSATYQQLTDQLVLDPTVIPFQSRYQLLNDAFVFSNAALQDPVVAMETTRYLDQEDHFLVWDTFATAFEPWAEMLGRYPITDSELTTYMRSKLDPVYDTLGWNNGNDGNYVQALRALILKLSCFYGRSECISGAEQKLAELEASQTGNPIPPDQRVAVYCSVVRSGGVTSAWNALFAEYNSIADTSGRGVPTEIARLLKGMGCPDNTGLLQTFIDYTFNPQLIRGNDVNEAWTSLTSSPDGPFYVFGYLKDNWNADPTPPGVSKYNVFQACANRFASDADLAEVNDFIATNPPLNQLDQNAYDDALATVNANLAWNNANNQAFQDWFIAN